MAHKVVVQVRGRRPFPLDMLRYDNLMPESEADSALIQRSIAEPYDGIMEVTLKRLCQTKADAKQFATQQQFLGQSSRWSSFGWSVAKVEAVTW